MKFKETFIGIVCDNRVDTMELVASVEDLLDKQEFVSVYDIYNISHKTDIPKEFKKIGWKDFIEMKPVKYGKYAWCVKFCSPIIEKPRRMFF